MMAILGIVITFILTFFIGNKITEARQQDSWLAQQRFSGEEKEYLELKKLSEEIAASMGIRIFAMQRLALQLLQHNEANHNTIDDCQDAIKNHTEAVIKWNETLTSHYTRLTQLDLNAFRYRLESSLHTPMRIQSSALDKAIIGMKEGRRDSAKIILTNALKAINAINGSATNFNLAILGELNKKRKEIYFPEKIRFSEDTMGSFSNWQLIKAIFVKNVNSVTVRRSPLDS